jgi:D-glucosaminate-6-phosphate ammonia-lyase
VEDLVQVINAAGKMTALGASAVDPVVANAVGSALQTYFDMAQLMEWAGQELAHVTGAEAGMPVASAAAGIVTAVAACITRDDLRRIDMLPQSEPPHEVMILRSHVVNFGASIEQMIRLGGGVPVEVGTVNKASKEQLASSLTLRTAAILYVVSHHVIAEGSIPLAHVVECARAQGVPVIVDAAAEMDLQKYRSAGANLIIYSGQKAIGGPTSGVLVGREDLIRAAKLNARGIGRAMKVSKEAIVGLMTAIHGYVERDGFTEDQKQAERMERLVALLGDIPGVDVELVRDETRPITRVSLYLGQAAPLSAFDLIGALEAGAPSIRTRNHRAVEGTILFDPRTLRDGDETVIAQRVRDILGLSAATVRDCQD